MSNQGFDGSMTRRRMLGALGAAGAASLLAPHAIASADTLASPSAAKKYQGVTLHMLSQGGVAYQPAFQAYAAEFQKQTGATVVFDFTPWGSLMPKIQASLSAGGSQYDLFCSDIEFQYTVYPHLLPINDLIKSHNYDMSGFFAPIYKYGVGIGGQKGVRYGLPMTSETSVIFYRTDLIPHFPTTWAGYNQVLAKTTDRGKGKYGLSFPGISAQLPKHFWARYWGQGVPLFTPGWKPLVNGPTGVKALTMLRDQMTQYSPPGILAWDNPEASNAFLNGDVAVLEGWPDFTVASLNDPSASKVVNKWAIAPYPEGGTGNFTEHNVIIFKNTAHPDAAFDFAALVTSLSTAKVSLTKYKVDVARESLYVNPSFDKQMSFLPGEANVFNRGKAFLPNVPQWIQLLGDLGDGLSSAMAGKATPKAALDSIAGKWVQDIQEAPLSFPYHE